MQTMRVLSLVALMVYFKEESMDLAIWMLDETEFRVGEAGTVMRVKQGEFTHKESRAGGEGGGATSKACGG
jgi:HIV Tat-specific factor 1